MQEEEGGSPPEKLKGIIGDGHGYTNEDVAVRRRERHGWSGGEGAAENEEE